jgi:UDP-N-acetyl-D-mannosaminuronate dehydrogenase
MTHNPKFGPAAQTPEQRAWVLEQMQRVIPGLKTKLNAYTQQLYARYVAGELSWQQVRQARDAAAASQPAL